MRISSLIAAIIIAWNAQGLFAQTAGEQSLTTVNLPVIQLAQNGSTTKAAPARSLPGVPPSSNPKSPAGTSEIRYLKDEAGNIYPIPLEKLLEFERSKALNGAAPKQVLPDYSVNRVELSGVIKGEWAELTAEIFVKINRDGKNFLVPLGFNEATLINFDDHNSEGKVVFDSKDPRNGQKWWFQGKGQHHLTLNFIVPVRPRGVLQNLSLTLPANTSTRHAKLRLPTAQEESSDQEYEIRTVLPQNILLKKQKLEESGLTEISFPIPGKNLDFSWQILEKKTEEEINLNSDTEIEMEFQYTTILLNVKQTVEALSGSFDSIEVEIPRNFEPINVNAPGYLQHDIKDANTLRVELKEPVTGPITFEYDLESDIPLEPLVLDRAFQLKGARTNSIRQTGTVKIRETQSFQVSHLPEGDDAVIRADVSLFKSEFPLSHAFKFYNQPFSLSFQIEKIKPKVSIEPLFELEVTQSTTQSDQVQLNLETRINMTVRKGELEEFPISWPGFEAEKWEEPSEPTTRIVEEVRRSETVKNLFFVKFLKPQSGNFELVLSSRRFIPAGKAGQKLSLPEFSEVFDFRTSMLEIAGAPNLETTLNAGEGTILRRPTINERPVPDNSETVGDSPLRNLWTLEQPNHQLLVEIQEKKRSITSESQLTIYPNPQNSRVVQRVDLNVNYVPLEQLAFQIPTGMNLADFKFRNANNQPLPSPTMSGSATSTSGQVASISFPQQILGDSSFYVEFQVPTPAFQEGEARLEIPFLQFNSVTFEAMKLSVIAQDQYQVLVNSKNWVPLPTSQTGQLNWETQQVNGQLILTLKETSQRLNQNYHVSQVLANIYFSNNYNSNGENHAEIEYQLTGKPTLITFKLPSNVLVETFKWNGDSKNNELKKTPTGAYLEYNFIPPESNLNQHRFSILYSGGLQRTNTGNWVHDYQYPLPQFDEEINFEKTLLSLNLPNAQHLLTPPPNWQPLFSWQKEGLFFFSRLPLPGLRDQDVYQQLHKNPNSFSPYQYDLYRFGKPTEIRVQALSQSVIVLIGAGTAFLCGFLIRKLRFMHNMVSFLLFTFLIACLGLWYWPAMQLFLQPALIGIILACIAIGIEEWMRRRHSLDFLEINPSEDFVLTPARSVGTGTQPISSEDSTAIRPPSKQSTTLSALESGKET